MPHKDPEVARAYHQAYHKKHREHLLQKMHQRYQENPQYYRDRSTQWYRDNPERATHLRRQARHRAPWKYMLKTAEERARKKRVPFCLTVEWAKNRYTGFCELTGLPFLIGKNGCGPASRSPSLDRIEAKLGYTPNNCRFILACVNNFKHDGTEEEMIEVLHKLIEVFPRKTPQ